MKKKRPRLKARPFLFLARFGIMELNMKNIALHSINQGLFPVVIKLLIIFLPIFIPIMLIVVFWILRYRWLTLKFVESQKTCLFEIRLPKEILKSPAGMEIFFSHLSGSGADNWGEAFIDGKTRPWFSCEIVSIGGDVKFFIWTSQAKFKNLIQAQLYGQYPNIEIHEIDPKNDYVNAVQFDTEKYEMYGVQYKYGEPDPYPIKTYIDYGLDQDPKDEYKVDPLASLLEFWGTLKPGENMWFQIMIQKHEKEDWKHGVLKREARDIKEEHKAEIEKIRQEATPKPEGEDDKFFKFPNPTKGQIEKIAALERSAGKVPLDCMIRSMYIAEKSVFNPANISPLIGCLKQFGSANLNSIKFGFLTDIDPLEKDLTRIFPFFENHFSFDPFDGFKSNNARRLEMKKEIFHAYKLRSFFQWPYKHYHGKPMVMNVEELATIFHFPSGIVSQTPTLKRVESKKSEAPSNLPI